MHVTADELARAMFSARCKACNMTEDDVVDVTGEGYEQYIEIAEPIAEFINKYDVEALAVAELLMDRKLMGNFFSSLGF